MTTEVGYYKTISDLKAIAASDRVDGLTFMVAGLGAPPSWQENFTYYNALTKTDDGYTYLTPNDGIGCWQRSGMQLIQYAKLSEVQPSGINGGSYTSNSVSTRNLNTIDTSQPWLSLSNNNFILQPGTYQVRAASPFRQTDVGRIWIQNVTANFIALLGQSIWISNASQISAIAHVTGILTPTTATTYSINYQFSYNQGGQSQALGVPASIAEQNEVYTILEIEKIA